MQHDPQYVAAVQALETRLGNDGYTPREWVDSVYTHPYRAQLLGRLIAESRQRSQEPRTICEVGFGAGHSALLFLTLAPKSTVHTFELGLGRVSVPAHEYMDEAFPERLWIYLGESATSAPRLPDFFPESACDLIFLDGGITYNAVATDLSNFRRLANPFGHVVVLAGAGSGTAALRAWGDATQAGKVAWEGTVSEAPGQVGSDALVFGRFVGEDVGDVTAVGREYRKQQQAQQAQTQQQQQGQTQARGQQQAAPQQQQRQAAQQPQQAQQPAQQQRVQVTADGQQTTAGSTGASAGSVGGDNSQFLAQFRAMQEQLQQRQQQGGR